MDEGPLVSEWIEAGAQLVRILPQYLPFQAAYWLKVPPDSRWYLWVATELIDRNRSMTPALAR